MQPTRLQALTLVALAATPACAPVAGTGPAPTPLPPAMAVPSAGPTPAPDPSATPTDPPRSTASEGPSAGPWVSASAPAPGGRHTILSGHVYDAAGALVSGARVTVRSLDASVPYLATAETDDGSYVVNNVPEGALMEVTATKAGWTSRTRTGTFEQRGTGLRNSLDFGGPGDDDPQAPVHFLSDRPEIVAVTPAEDGPGLPARAMRCLLKLSEPLSEEDASRFTRALRVWPADARDLTRDDGTYPADEFAWAIAEGTRFFGRRATVSWNAARDEALLSFDDALGAARGAPTRYQVGLVAQAPVIADRGRRALGVPGAIGTVLRQAFRRPALTALPAVADASEAWAATHASTAAFTVAPDDTPPQLLAVAASRVLDDLRLTLTFDEPLAAVDGRLGGRRDPSLAFVATGDPAQPAATGDPLGFLTFALGGTEAEVADARLTAPDPFDPRPAGARLPADGRAHRFVAAALAASPRRAALRPGADDGRITAVLDPDDPRRLHLDVFWRAGLLGDGRFLRVRVEGLADPAGNRIGAREADADALTIRP